MHDSQQALKNLILLAHAEIRALRDVVGLLAAAADPAAPVNGSNWEALEADYRRRHLEALKLPLDRFDALLSEAMIQHVLPKAAEERPGA